jgi:hypothetical protein
MDRLLAAANMAKAIDLPMKRREGVPVTYVVPVKKGVPKIEEIKVEDTFNPEAASGRPEKPYDLTLVIGLPPNRWNLGAFGKHLIGFIHAGKVPTALVAFITTGSRLI